MCESAKDLILPDQALLTSTEVVFGLKDPDVTGLSSESDDIRAAADAEWLHARQWLIVVTTAAMAIMPPAVGVGLGAATGLALEA